MKLVSFNSSLARKKQNYFPYFSPKQGV